MEYDVFISCKSEDYKYAEEIYYFLKNNGFNTFLANKELRQMGDSEYRRAISQALKSTYHLIVFASNADYIDSEWVYYEWDWFLVAKIKGKKQGQLLSILKDVNIDDVNGDLWKYESKTFENYKESLLSYVETPAYLRRKKEAEEKERLEEEKRKLEKEAEQRKRKILKEIEDDSADYRLHSSNLESLAKKIIENQEKVGHKEKTCPVCSATQHIGEVFCKKCGWTFTPIFEDKPFADKEKVFILRNIWKKVKEFDSITESLSQKNNSLEFALKENNEIILDLKNELSIRCDENKAIREQLDRDQLSLKNDSSQITKLNNTIKDYEKEINSLKDSIEKLKSENTILKRKKPQEDSNKFFTQILKTIELLGNNPNIELEVDKDESIQKTTSNSSSSYPTPYQHKLCPTKRDVKSTIKKQKIEKFNSRSEVYSFLSQFGNIDQIKKSDIRIMLKQKYNIDVTAPTIMCCNSKETLADIIWSFSKG